VLHGTQKGIHDSTLGDAELAQKDGLTRSDLGSSYRINLFLQTNDVLDLANQRFH